MMPEFASRVLCWFDQHGRKTLPWQLQRDAFRVWVSEIMLQQTQVTTVVPYFERFVECFPTVAELASASEESVLAHWAGLGYYARARNLHRCAVAVAEQHGGEFPRNLEGLVALPGIGRSTAGAILSLGYGIPAAILDGNVKRLLCRHFGIEGWPGNASVARELWAVSERLTPTDRCGQYNQAMMDLGAMICTPTRPSCSICPIRDGCTAHREGRTASLPTRRSGKALPVRAVSMVIVQDDSGHVFLEKRAPAGVWGGLWCFPMFGSADEMKAWQERSGITGALVEELPRRRHTLSHFHMDYVPFRMRAASAYRHISEPSEGRWVNPQLPLPVGVPAPVRQLLDHLFPIPEGVTTP
jgi:A/G-specific adenine glycosylase